MWRLLPLLASLAWLPMPASGFDHSRWSGLLAEHLVVSQDGRVSQVDYRGMAGDIGKLDAYLSLLAGVPQGEFSGWPEDVRLAFLINAYNAATVRLILTQFPDLDSIRDLGWLFRSPWKKEFVSLFGKQYSLDDIEHGMIRGRFSDPRIHFAVNCASVGCPMLREEAYRGADLDRQLEEQTRRFLSDRSRNRLSGPGTLALSSIFKWYREDFANGWRGHESLESFLSDYRGALDLTPSQADALRDDRMAIEFLDYDWRLNDAAAATRLKD
ncbi:DUF547 domain-containing protein [Microbulbifer flavimaris]|uniref:DUF547 domain-containing protein n=1 Tax=Microbulbifer flavimaris TaxID=1781068 RepID=A0ABX4I3G6_9GAMM|nr:MULTISPECIES: DUF547 domain-containing protein [Microbulbifer]KUJ84790.1 hypothetical protein AVO43_03855 [Microbulbifer sp. ZGT114]PCO06886.1 DUF547 domain-containing protein [Microbulbifer flavimaris]